MRFICFCLIILTSFSGYAQPGDSAFTARIEKRFSRYTAENPGCQVSIARNGRVLYSRAWGKANLETGTDLTTTSLIEAGSVSKQFTAACILLLEQQGKLALEDDIRKYIPELPDYGTIIKVKHLVHHTSGIKDWGSVAELTGFGRGTKAYRNEDALAIAARQQTLNNVPGAEFVYSNSNYNILAIVVQRVSGMSLAAYSHQYIFVPAGMSNTQWRDNYKRVVPNRSIAYARTSQTEYETDMPNEDVYGNGGLLTTTEDLLKWNEFYWSGKFGQPSLLKKQTALDTFNNRRMNFYGAGLMIQTSKGQRVIRHSGATGSYRAYLAYYPDLKLSIAWLSNTSRYDTAAYDVMSELESLYVQRPSSPEKKEPAPFNVTAETLSGYAGLYRNTRTSGGLRLTATDSQLLIENRTALQPAAERKFALGSDILVFDTKKNFIWTNEDYDSVRYVPVMSAEANLPLSSYTGQFFSAEADAKMNIIEQNGALYLEFNSYTSYRLQPVYKDGFRILGFGGMLNFDRQPGDKITTFRITLGRARNIVFNKIN